MLERRRLESELERKIIDYAEATGWFQFKIMQASKRSIMDRVLIKNGVVLWAEIKRDSDEDLRAQQAHRADEMRRYGAICLKWDNFEDAKRDLKIHSL